jgi:hypothetical protein
VGGTAFPQRRLRRHHDSGRGNVRLYWGTENQGLDPLLATSGTVHPAYRGQAYLVFNQLFFGQDRTNAPNIEVQVAALAQRRLAADAQLDQDDVNPVIPLWDLWTNPATGWACPKAGSTWRAGRCG